MGIVQLNKTNVISWELVNLAFPDKNQCSAPPLPCPPTNQNKFNNYISLRRDNYSLTCQMNNFVYLTTKYEPQVLRDNPENQAELWPLPQNKHLSKQMDLVFKIYNKYTTYDP